MGLKMELIDRFGKLPRETNNFINLALIRLLYRETIVRVITINKNSVVFELPEKGLGENTISGVLNYKNHLVLNKKFREGPSSLMVSFVVLEGFDWFSLVVDSNSLFCV